ncbi:nucleotide-diphospho-sugar transferase [Polychytrium aggregatum]|uniref:nucleotide-diphospho-sugar transferase n=1 Tax=Polychytrium aggregatum TaxID=110093 RepID=UPI0022FED6E4|nr:nucleotide-diphospho-sugar transferase [Polychytrium aggregatum]KAI9207948.1 nucleotide-diphospho-sugar transferase [Polychytrium aggregatum]
MEPFAKNTQRYGDNPNQPGYEMAHMSELEASYKQQAQQDPSLADYSTETQGLFGGPGVTRRQSRFTTAPRYITGSRRFVKKRDPRFLVVVKILFTFLGALCLVCPVIVGYIFHFNLISTQQGFFFGLYGVFVICHYFIQACFATANRLTVNRKVRNRDPNWRGLATGVLVVGYREDPELYRQCLESCKALQYNNLRRVMMVVDGDEQEDEYMGTIFQEVFGPEATVIAPGFNLVEVGPDSREAKWLYNELAQARGPICILQKHGGKRHAMYCGFHVFLNCIPTDAIMVTDSDTYLDCNAVKELAFMLNDPKVGAATGDVRIWNDDNWISFLSALRYWFAFNMERACQSFHKCVGCVSGPLGIYRTEIIRVIIEPWVSQKFLGIQCTYGDDRHLTNLTLKLGQQVVYTHYAWCLTETPTQFIRWTVQQTRWSKSFYREGLYNSRWFHKHSIWMAYEMIFQTVYPGVLLYIFLYTLFFGTLLRMLMWANVLIVMGFLKATYAVIITKNVKYLLVSFYGFLYLCGLMIAKIHAVLFLWDNGWGTSSRLGAKMSKWQQYVFPFGWNLIIIGGMSYNITKFVLASKADVKPIWYHGFDFWHILFSCTLAGAIVIGLIGYGLYKTNKWMMTRRGLTAIQQKV